MWCMPVIKSHQYILCTISIFFFMPPLRKNAILMPLQMAITPTILPLISNATSLHLVAFSHSVSYCNSLISTHPLMLEIINITIFIPLRCNNFNTTFLNLIYNHQTTLMTKFFVWSRSTKFFSLMLYKIERFTFTICYAKGVKMSTLVLEGGQEPKSMDGAWRIIFVQNMTW